VITHFLAASPVTVHTGGFQALPWYVWLLIGIIAGMIVRGKWG
jgi:hypothetical protein